MTKLDWTKGYVSDPGRFQVEEASALSNLSKAAEKKKTQIWAKALRRLRTNKRSQNTNIDKAPISQQALLCALGLTRWERKAGRSGFRFRICIQQGILLADGTPNLDHPKVREIIALKAKKKTA